MCQKLTEVFPSPKDMCEKIWSYSYKYTTFSRGSGRCIQMWFDPKQGNPNEAVAKYYAGAGQDLRGTPLVLLGLVLVALL